MPVPTPSPPTSALRPAIETIESRTGGATILFGGDVSKQLWSMHRTDVHGNDHFVDITARAGKVYPTRRTGVLEHFAHYINSAAPFIGVVLIRVADVTTRDSLQALCPKLTVICQAAPARITKALLARLEDLRVAPLLTVDIFTDASIARKDPDNPNVAGLGWVITYDAPVAPLVGSISVRADNIRHAETLAILGAIHGLIRAHHELGEGRFGTIRINTDSKASIHLITQMHDGKLRGHASRNEIHDARRVSALMSKMNITLQWVRGHNGHLQNESADRLARMARLNFIAGTDQIDTAKMIRYASNELGKQMRTETSGDIPDSPILSSVAA